MKFSYIIAFRYSSDRLRNIKSILNWLKNFDCEIIIVESDISSKIDSLSEFNFKHIFLPNNYPFNKSWCFNVGWMNSSSDKIVFGDADLIMNIDSLNQAVSQLDQYECVNPYSSVVDLSPIETDTYINSQNLTDLFSIERPGRGENDHQKVPMCGGIILFQKESLNKVVGWCEDFWGWGAEDDFMSKKVEHYLKHINLKEKCYHLYHEKAPVFQDLYYRNLKIFSFSANASKEQFTEYLNKIVGTIGNLEKKLQ